MVASNVILAAVLALPATSLQPAPAGQQSGRTVRHHKLAEPGESAPPELLQAESALDKKDFASAEALLRQVVAHDAGNYRAWFDLGFAYTGLERRDDAIAAFRKSVALDPDVFESNLNLGLALADQKDAEAADYLRAATRLKPASSPDQNLAHAWMALGRVLAQRSPAEALDALLHASALQPQEAQPHLESARILAEHNDAPAAEREYLSAAKLDPHSVEAISGLADLYLKSNRLDAAENTLRQYLELDPQNGPAHVVLGRVLRREGKNDDALAELQRGVQLSPGDPNAARDLAFAYAAAGKYQEAESLLRTLLARNAGDAELRYALGNALMHQHKYPDAQSALLAAVQLQPAQPEPYGDLAVVANENKNYELVIKALDARARLAPESPATYFLRATAYDHLRLFKPAAENYRQFLASAGGKFPDQEWQAKHRLIAIDPKARR
jgi:Flp pilus assembly protein TadD